MHSLQIVSFYRRCPVLPLFPLLHRLPLPLPILSRSSAARSLSIYLFHPTICCSHVLHFIFISPFSVLRLIAFSFRLVFLLVFRFYPIKNLFFFSSSFLSFSSFIDFIYATYPLSCFHSFFSLFCIFINFLFFCILARGVGGCSWVERRTECISDGTANEKVKTKIL